MPAFHISWMLRRSLVSPYEMAEGVGFVVQAALAELHARDGLGQGFVSKHNHSSLRELREEFPFLLSQMTRIQESGVEDSLLILGTLTKGSTDTGTGREPGLG